MVSVLSVIVSGLVENTACAPNKLILLSNCSFKSPFSLTDPSSSSPMTIDNRTLSMTVPHLFEPHADENPAIEVIRRPASKVPLIRFNLNLIQCSIKKNFTWTSVEASSTLRGEFIRTSSIDINRMYLSLGVTYLRNLTSINCTSRTIYRTDPRQVFRVHFQRESTLNDSCSNESLCYPSNIYRCDSERRHCQCRSPLQAYLTDDHSSICIHAVKTIDQCTLKNVRCLPWCDDSSSSKMCLCPAEFSTKKYFDEDRGNVDRSLSNALIRLVSPSLLRISNEWRLQCIASMSTRRSMCPWDMRESSIEDTSIHVLGYCHDLNHCFFADSFCYCYHSRDQYLSITSTTMEATLTFIDKFCLQKETANDSTDNERL